MNKKDITKLIKNKDVFALCLVLFILVFGITYSFVSIYLVNKYFTFVIKCLGCE